MDHLQETGHMTSCCSTSSWGIIKSRNEKVMFHLARMQIFTEIHVPVDHYFENSKIPRLLPSYKFLIIKCNRKRSAF